MTRKIPIKVYEKLTNPYDRGTFDYMSWSLSRISKFMTGQEYCDGVDFYSITYVNQTKRIEIK